MKLFQIICIWLCALFFTNKLQSQNYLETYTTLVTKHKKDPKYNLQSEVVDSLLTLCVSSKNYEVYSFIASDFSKYIYKSHLKEAIRYSELALEKYPKLKQEDSIYADFRFRLGFFYSKHKEYEKSNAQYLAIIEAEKNPARVAQSYSQLGLYYSSIGDYYKAESYYTKGIPLLEEQKEYSKLINQYYNLYRVYYYQNTKASLQKGKETLDRALALEKNGYTIKPSKKSDIYTGYATYYTEIDHLDFDKARAYHLKNLELLKKENNTSKICTVYANLSDLYNVTRKDSAYYYIQKTLENCPENANYANHHLSQYYRYRGDLENALKYIQESLTVSTGIKNTKTTIISYRDLEKVKNKKDLFTAFAEKAQVLKQLFEVEKDTNHLVSALDNVLMADTLIDLIQEETDEEKSQLHWREEASSLYVQGVEICKLLNKPAIAFSFIEKNKALLLTSGISTNARKKQLPQHIQNRLHTLRKEILTLETSISESENKNIKKEQQEQLFELKLHYQHLDDSIVNTYKWYSNNTLKDHLITLNEVQKDVKDNNVIISYIWGKNRTTDQELVYGMYIESDHTEFFEVEDVDTLKHLINSYRFSLSKPLETKSDITNYQQSAFAIYEKLIPIASIRNAISGKRIRIIPDGELQYIPFEALLRSQNPSDYFITSNQINYSYSLSFSKNNEALNRDYNMEFIGFAPVNFSYDNLLPLRKSKAEIDGIKNNLEGITFIEKEATKENFLTKSNTSNIIHLATHADASSNPWIAFHDTKLQSHELYTYQNNAELVVLSACNTNIGDIVHGEGVMSLARGFFYAGANTVVSSLWETNDKVTAQIMDSFYSHIKKGASKADALHLAKLDYLNTSKLSQQSPYYWAPFILIGETDTPLYSSSNNTSLYILILLSILLIIVILYLKRKK